MICQPPNLNESQDQTIINNKRSHRGQKSKASAIKAGSLRISKGKNTSLICRSQKDQLDCFVSSYRASILQASRITMLSHRTVCLSKNRNDWSQPTNYCQMWVKKRTKRRSILVHKLDFISFVL